MKYKCFCYLGMTGENRYEKLAKSFSPSNVP
ncbi:unnamed protein product [Cuscuta epithymum]|uniref:Uncharacterized protein n=1 Tax=Cuscuta epithymum TaxID=186058 RepID=A0AAV0DEG3_9ASTE|nr:unnamed protein product [Cuscuta epithymum]